jgi:hypothetical protein
MKLTKEESLWADQFMATLNLISLHEIFKVELIVVSWFRPAPVYRLILTPKAGSGCSSFYDRDIHALLRRAVEAVS